MNVSLTTPQATFVLRLIQDWSNQGYPGDLNDALDALQLTLKLSEAMGKDLLIDTPDLAADLKKRYDGSRTLNRPAINESGVQRFNRTRPNSYGTPAPDPRPGPTLIPHGEFLTCSDSDVEYFRGQGYTVTRDEMLGMNFASPPAYCIHGRAFTVPCEFCQADQHANIAPVVRDIDIAQEVAGGVVES